MSLGGSSAFLRPETPGGDGATQFVGYASSGDQPFTNCDGRTVKKSSALTMSYVDPGIAAFSKTLTPGLYLIAAGGSCNAQDCGAPAKLPLKLDVRKAPVVPLPADPIVCGAGAEC